MVNIGTTGGATATAIAAGASSVYICGNWGGTFSFGSIRITWPGAPATLCGFIAKLTPGIGWRWAKQ